MVAKTDRPGAWSRQGYGRRIVVAERNLPPNSATMPVGVPIGPGGDDLQSFLPVAPIANGGDAQDADATCAAYGT